MISSLKLTSPKNYNFTITPTDMQPKDYDLWMNNLPKCPKCGHEDEDWWDGMSHDAGDGYEYEDNCGVCDQHYKTTMFIETKFTTELLK